MVRHFAYFADVGRPDGKFGCVREMKGETPDPDIAPSLVGDARIVALNAWQQWIAPADPHEIGLDVTQANKPVGALRWWVFDPVARQTSEPDMHTFVLIDLTDGGPQLAGVHQSSQPLEPPCGRVAIDVTGTPLEAVAVAWMACPDRALPPLVRDVLAIEARPDFDTFMIQPPVGALVERSA